MGCARTGCTRARQRPQWAVTAATALAVGCCGGGGTAGSGLGGHRRAAGLRSISSGSGCREPGHWKGEAHNGGMAHGCGFGHRRAQSRGGPGGKMRSPPPPPPPFFFIEPLGSRRVQGQLKGQILPWLRNSCCTSFHLHDQQNVDLGKSK